MGDEDVKLTLTSEDAGVIQTIQRIDRELAKLVRSNLEIKKKTEDNQNVFVKFGSSALAGIKGMVAGYIGAQGLKFALDEIRQAYQRWREELEKTHQAAVTGTKALVTQISGVGQTFNIDKIQKFRDEVLSRLKFAKPEEFTQAFGAVFGAAPGLSLEQAQPLIEGALQGKAAGVDITQLGQVLGNLAELAPDKKADDLLDLAKFFMDLAGDDREQLAANKSLRGAVQLRNVGFSEEEVLGLLTATLRSKQAPTSLAALADLATENIETPKAKFGRPLTEDEQKQAQLAALGAKERVLKVLEDQSFAPESLRNELTAIAKEGPLELVKQALAAQQVNYFASEVSRLALNPEFRKYMQSETTGARAQRSAEAFGLRETGLTDSQKEAIIRANLQDKGLAGTQGDLIFQAVFERLKSVIGVEEAANYASNAPGVGQQIAEAIRRAFIEIGNTQQSEEISRIQTNKTEEMIRALEANTAELRALRRGGTADPNRGAQ